MKRTTMVLMTSLGLGVALGACSVLPEGDAFFDPAFMNNFKKQDGQAATTMALGSLARGDSFDAERHFKQALQIDPKDVHALLGLGIIYHNSGQPTRARAMYEAVLALHPEENLTMVVLPSTQTRPVSEIASVNLGLLNSGVKPQTAMPAATPGHAMPGQAMPGQTMPGQTMPGQTMPGQTMNAQPMAPVHTQPMQQPAAMQDVRFAQGDANILGRFKTMRGLVDQGLITQDEFITRRQANVGALIPMTSPLPAAGLDRPVPSAEQISGRLRAIGRALEMRALSVAQHQAERTMILDALMPAAPVSVAAPAMPPKGLMAAADAVRRLEHLREQDVITPDEYARERAAIENSMTPPAGKPSKATPTPAQAMGSTGAAKSLSGFQPAVHLASYQNQRAAEKGWKTLARTHSALLSKLQPSYERVDLGAKGVFIRLKVGPLPSNNAAKSLCRKLKAKRQFCEPSTVHYG